MVGSVETYTLRTYHDDLCLTEKLQECESNSPNKPPFAINYLQYYNSHEPVTSWIIRHLLPTLLMGSIHSSNLLQIPSCKKWIQT